MCGNGRWTAAGVAVVATLLLMGAKETAAQSDQIMTRPGAACRVQALPEWTAQEQWVWQRVCAGNIANLANKFGGSTDPDDADRWPNTRTIRSTFLETILLHEPFRSALPRLGVRIEGAKFHERLDLSGAKVIHELWVDESFLEMGVNLINAHFANRVTFDYTKSPEKLDLGAVRVDKELSFRGGKFGAIDLSDAAVGTNLLMADGTFEAIDLSGAKIGSRVDLSGSKVTGNLDMTGLQTGGALYLDREAYFGGTVELISASIGALVSLRGSTFGEVLSLQSLSIAGDLFMGDTKLRQVVLRGVSVGRQIQLSGASVTGKIDMENLRVGLDLLMHGSRFSEARLIGIRVGIDISIAGSTFTSDLTLDSVQADGGLYLDSGATFAGVSLFDVRFGRQIRMSSSKFAGNVTFRNVEAGRSLSMSEGTEFNGDVNIEGLQVKGTGFIRDAKFSGEVIIVVSAIEGSLIVSGSELRSLDLSGTSIGGQLVFVESTPIQWQKKSRLVLRNTIVSSVADSPECWPDDLTLVLSGFVYKTWGACLAFHPRSHSTPCNGS